MLGILRRNASESIFPGDQVRVRGNRQVMRSEMPDPHERIELFGRWRPLYHGAIEAFSVSGRIKEAVASSDGLRTRILGTSWRICSLRFRKLASLASFSLMFLTWKGLCALFYCKEQKSALKPVPGEFRSHPLGVGVHCECHRCCMHQGAQTGS